MAWQREHGAALTWLLRGDEGKAVTEAEWLECTNPLDMLEFLRGKASDRKLRLFACVCIAEYLRFMAWPRMHTDKLQAALGTNERYADGLVPHVEWRRETRGNWHFFPFKSEDAFGEAHYGISSATGVAAWDQSASYNEKQAADERTMLAGFLRCILGNPFRAVALAPSSRSPTVTSLAQAIYDERRFDDLPILADSLEESGCTKADILDHLRSPGPHVKGCWALDLILDKQ